LHDKRQLYHEPIVSNDLVDSIRVIEHSPVYPSVTLLNPELYDRPCIIHTKDFLESSIFEIVEDKVEVR